MGLTTGVDISPGEKSGVVVDDFSTAIRLEARLGDCPSWRQRRFPSDVEPLTEQEGANGAVSTVEVVASDITASSSEWLQNVLRTRHKGMITMMMMRWTLEKCVLERLLVVVILNNLSHLIGIQQVSNPKAKLR